MAYELYYHKPNSQKMTFVGKVDNCDPLNGDIKEEQYMAVFKSGAQVLRYFVTREAGPLEVISLNMEDDTGRFRSPRPRPRRARDGPPEGAEPAAAA